MLRTNDSLCSIICLLYSGQAMASIICWLLQHLQSRTVLCSPGLCIHQMHQVNSKFSLGFLLILLLMFHVIFVFCRFFLRQTAACEKAVLQLEWILCRCYEYFFQSRVEKRSTQSRHTAGTVVYESDEPHRVISVVEVLDVVLGLSDNVSLRLCASWMIMTFDCFVVSYNLF